MEDGLRTVMKEYIDQVDDVCLRLLDGLCLKSKADFLCSRKLRWGIEYDQWNEVSALWGRMPGL